MISIKIRMISSERNSKLFMEHYSNKHLKFVFEKTVHEDLNYKYFILKY